MKFELILSMVVAMMTITVLPIFGQFQTEMMQPNTSVDTNDTDERTEEEKIAQRERFYDQQEALGSDIKRPDNLTTEAYDQRAKEMSNKAEQDRIYNCVVNTPNVIHAQLCINEERLKCGPSGIPTEEQGGICIK